MSSMSTVSSTSDVSTPQPNETEPCIQDCQDDSSVVDISQNDFHQQNHLSPYLCVQNQLSGTSSTTMEIPSEDAQDVQGDGTPFPLPSQHSLFEQDCSNPRMSTSESVASHCSTCDRYASWEVTGESYEGSSECPLCCYSRSRDGFADEHSSIQCSCDCSSCERAWHEEEDIGELGEVEEDRRAVNDTAHSSANTTASSSYRRSSSQCSNRHLTVPDQVLIKAHRHRRLGSFDESYTTTTSLNQDIYSSSDSEMELEFQSEPGAKDHRLSQTDIESISTWSREPQAHLDLEQGHQAQERILLSKTWQWLRFWRTRYKGNSHRTSPAKIVPVMNSGPRISVWTSSSSTRTATLASTNASILGDEAESRPPSASYSVGTSDVKEQRESGTLAKWKDRWRRSRSRSLGRHGGSTTDVSKSGSESGRERSLTSCRRARRRGSEESRGAKGIQHALRVGFMSTLGPGIPITPTVSVFGEQLANGMFNKNNPGGLFGYSREEEKRLVRKIDYRLLPILGTFYAFSTLNRANLTNARIFAYESALHATNEQYTWAIAMFYCGFGLAEIPSIFALLYLTPKIWLPLSMFAWAIVIVLMAWARSFPFLMVLRFLLGMFEAALIPGVLIYIAMFYKRSEQTFRLAILSLFNSASGAFGGLVAGAIGLLHGVAGLDGWQWVFILESIPTAICAVTAYFILAKTPEAAPWLNQRETSIAIYRIRNDTKIKVNRTFSKKTIMTAVKDPKVYLFMSLNLILTSLTVSSTPVLTRAWMEVAKETTQHNYTMNIGNGSSLNAAYHVQVQDHMYKTPPPPSLFLWNPTLMADTDVLLPLRRRQISSSTTLMAKLPHTTKLPSPRYPNPRKPRPTSAPSPSPRPSPSGIPFMPRGSTVSTVPSNSTVNNNNNNNKTSTINSPPKNTATPEPDSDDETMLPPIDTTSPPDPGVAAAFEEMTVRARILAQLLSSPPYFFGGLLTFAVAVIVDRTQQRAYMIVALSFFTICGYACELITTNVHARYTASFIIYAGQSAMMPVATSWLTTNVGGYAKRAIAVAIYQLGASLAGVMGSQYYRTKHAPRYVVGHSVNIGFLIVLIGCTALQRWRLARANYRRSYSVAFGLNPIRGLSKAEIRDLGDNHPAYRYTL